MLNGRLTYKGIDYGFTYDSEGTNERLDIYPDGSDYSPISTVGVDSYIKTNMEAYTGNLNFLNTVLDILHKSYSTEESRVEESNILVILKSKEQTRTETISMSTGRVQRIDIEGDDFNLSAIINTFASTLNTTPTNINEYIVIGSKKTLYDTSTGKIRTLEYMIAENPYLKVILKRDYVVVKSMDDFYSRFDEIVHNQEQFIGFDIETSGLGVNFMQNDELSGVIISNKIGKSTYYPFRQPKFKFNLDLKYLRMIKDTLDNQKDDVIILAHNQVMEQKGMYKEFHSPMRINKDTMQLSIMVNPMFNAQNPHDLKSIEEEYDRIQIRDNFKDKLNLIQMESVLQQVRYAELKDIFQKKSDIDFKEVTEDIAQAYACSDGDGTIKAYKLLIDRLPKDELNLFDVESKVQVVKAINEFYGLRINVDKLVEYKNEVEERKNYLEELFHISVDDRRSITGKLALRDIIYRKLNAPVLVITKTEKTPAVNKTAISAILRKGAIQGTNDNIKPIEYKGEVLIKAKDLNNKYYPLVILQAFNLLEREYTTINRMLSLQVNGRIPFYCKAIGAASERQSSDAQQYGPRQKSVIIADSPDHNMWSCDYKQVELRILASEAGEKYIIEKANDPDSDLHRIIIAGIKGFEQYLITSEERSKAKSVNFGIVYMMGDVGLAKKIYDVTKPTEEQVTDARNRKTAFFNAYQKIKKFLLGNEEFILKNGYIKTKFGWYRYAKDILDSDIDEGKKASIIRQLNNTPIQGYGAALLKLVELRIQTWIHEKGWDKLVNCNGEMLPMVRMMLPIHDEILVSSHKSIPAEEILRMFKYCFEIDIKGACKYYAAPALVDNWGDGKDDAYEIPIKLRDKLVEDYEKTGVSKINKENWLQTLNEYRANEVLDWFNSLISESKDFNELWRKITHPNLTHVLISLELNKDETKKFPEQLDRIKLAAYKYITNKSKLEVCLEVDENIDIKSFSGYTAKVSDESKELKVEIDSDELYSIEDTSNQTNEQQEDTESEEVIVLDSSEDDVISSAIREDGVKPVIFLDQVFINDTDIRGDINIFVNSLRKLGNDDSDYKVYIVSKDGANYICNMDYQSVMKIGG